MISCPRCATSNEDDALVCRHCSTLLDGPRPMAARTGRVHRIDERAGGEPEGGPNGEPEATAGSSLDVPRPPTADGGDAFGTLRASFELPGPPAAEPSSARSEAEREERREEAPPLPPHRPAGGGLDAAHQTAISHYRQGRPVISVIGFPSSGKTFLVNRLRKQLPDRGDWSSNQRYERHIPVSPEGLIDTVFTAHAGGSGGRDGGGGNGRRRASYAVVDCAGESFDIAFSRQQQDLEIAGQGARSYLAALALASAYVFVIAAPTAVAAGRDREALEGFLYGFRNILAGILVAKRRLRAEEPEELLQRGISKPELDGALDLPLRLAEPLVVAFAQADRLAGLEPAPVGWDHDPYRFARHHGPALFHAARSHFRRYRFTFVSAFAGFEHRGAGAPEPDYALPAYGASALFDWIDRQLRPRLPLVGRLGRLAAGAPAAHAERLRRLVDRRFELGGSPS